MTAQSIFDYIWTLVCLIFFQKFFFTVRQSIFFKLSLSTLKIHKLLNVANESKIGSKYKKIYFMFLAPQLQLQILVLHLDFKIYNARCIYTPCYNVCNTLWNHLRRLASPNSLAHCPLVNYSKIFPSWENFDLLESEIIDIHTKYLIDTREKHDINCLNREPRCTCTPQQQEINCHQPPMQQLHHQLSKRPARYSSRTGSILQSYWIRSNIA